MACSNIKGGAKGGIINTFWESNGNAVSINMSERVSLSVLPPTARADVGSEWGL